MMDRAIPHIRDIFGAPDGAGKENYGTGRDRKYDEVIHEELNRVKHKKEKKNENDLKHLERHLSMKKTIRKKMMRDLQQALVADPDEIKQGCDPTSGLTFASSKTAKKRSENGFLDFLRTGGEKRVDGDDSARPDDQDDAGESDARKTGFWRRFTMRKGKR